MRDSDTAGSRVRMRAGFWGSNDGISAEKSLKSGDVDPRDIRENCWTISDKALAIGGGVLEAVLIAINRMDSGTG